MGFIYRTDEDEIVQAVGTALPRPPRGPRQCRAHSLDDFNLVGSVYKPPPGPSRPPDLWRTVLSFFFPLGHFRPFGFLGFRPGFPSPGLLYGLVWRDLLYDFPIFLLVTPIFTCFLGGVLRAVFGVFFVLFIFSRVRTALPIYGFDFSIASYSFLLMW